MPQRNQTLGASRQDRSLYEPLVCTSRQSSSPKQERVGCKKNVWDSLGTTNSRDALDPAAKAAQYGNMHRGPGSIFCWTSAIESLRNGSGGQSQEDWRLELFSPAASRPVRCPQVPTSAVRQAICAYRITDQGNMATSLSREGEVGRG